MPTKLKLMELQRMLSVALGSPIVINIWPWPLCYGYQRKHELVLVIPMRAARLRTKHELLFMLVRGLEKAVVA